MWIFAIAIMEYSYNVLSLIRYGHNDYSNESSEPCESVAVGQ